MYIRLPEVFCDAKQLVDSNISSNKRLVKIGYTDGAVHTCRVENFSIKAEDDEEVRTSLELTVEYKESVINNQMHFHEVLKKETLTLLCPYGDMLWPMSMVVKVWDGEYPSCVGINKETGVVYFIGVRESLIELIQFAKLTKEQQVTICEDLNEVQPYRIGLDSQAMFDVISGYEGNKKLKETLYIEFDCGVKFRVRSTETKNKEN